MQSEMRGVLRRMTAGTAGRIFDSASFRQIKVKQKAVSFAAKTREDTASVTRKHKFLDGYRGNLCVEEFR